MASGRSPPAEKVRLSEALPRCTSRRANTQRRSRGRSGTSRRAARIRRSGCCRSGLYLSDEYAGAAKSCVRSWTPTKRPGKTPPFDPVAAVVERLCEAERQRRLRLRAEKGARVLPEEGLARRHSARRRPSPDIRNTCSSTCCGCTRRREVEHCRAVHADGATRAQSGLRRGKRSASWISGSRAVLGVAAAEWSGSSSSRRPGRSRTTKKILAQNCEGRGATKDGTALVNVGYAMVSAGQISRGLD